MQIPRPPVWKAGPVRFAQVPATRHKLQQAKAAPPDPAAARRLARDDLAKFATAIRDLNQTCRGALDAGGETWTAFDDEAADLLTEAAATVLARLGGLEHRDFTEVPANIAHGTIGQRDGGYVRMTVLLSHRQHQLESWVSAIPAV